MVAMALLVSTPDPVRPPSKSTCSTDTAPWKNPTESGLLRESIAKLPAVKRRAESSELNTKTGALPRCQDSLTVMRG